MKLTPTFQTWLSLCFKSTLMGSLLLLFIYFPNIIKCITNCSSFSLMCLRWEEAFVCLAAPAAFYSSPVSMHACSKSSHLHCTYFPSALSFHLPWEPGPHFEWWLCFICNWLKLHGSQSLPFISSLSRCQVNPEVKTQAFMKQAGVLLEAYRHVDHWRVSCCEASLLSP